MGNPHGNCQKVCVTTCGFINTIKIPKTHVNPFSASRYCIWWETSVTKTFLKWLAIFFVTIPSPAPDGKKQLGKCKHICKRK